MGAVQVLGGRYELNLDPGPANSATQSSFASELAAAAEAAMKP